MLTVALAAALVLVIEGLAYAVAPRAMKSMMAKLQETPEEQLRALGLAAVGLGVLLVWAMRVMFG
jgi:uncharacterized protein YjeT (DUF2065 family)